MTIRAQIPEHGPDLPFGQGWPKPDAEQAEIADTVNHPSHYGGDTTYETIKVLEAWGLNDNARLWNAVKYISRAGKKADALEDLKKAAWYLLREIEHREHDG